MYTLNYKNENIEIQFTLPYDSDIHEVVNAFHKFLFAAGFSNVTIHNGIQELEEDIKETLGDNTND